MPSLFAQTFLPDGYPDSVAPEYARYQLWDTIQQCAFFTNTVISSMAIMRFHGVGVAGATPAAATALSMSRDLIAALFALCASTPGIVAVYKRHAAPFRGAAGVLDAAGHFVEVLAGLASASRPGSWMLYLGPIVCAVGGTVGGTVRSVILQHFGEGGSRRASPDYGDITLKESNQDKAGKVVGLAIGFALLSHFLSGAPASDGTSAASSDTETGMLGLFVGLGFVHIVGNAICTCQLRLQPAATEELQPLPPSSPVSPSTATGWQQPSFLRRMFLPPGYPRSMADSYLLYQLWARLDTAIAWPRAVVSQMVTWQFVYGVGDQKKTPAGAVQIDIFMQTVACVVALLSGFARVGKALRYVSPTWKLHAALIGLVARSVQLGAAFLAQEGHSIAFYALTALAQALAAFASTAGARVNGTIPNNLIRDREKVKLVDVKICDTNQALVVQMVSGLLCVVYLYHLVGRGVVPDTPSLIAVFAALQLFSFASALGVYRAMPLPDSDRRDYTEREEENGRLRSSVAAS